VTGEGLKKAGIPRWSNGGRNEPATTFEGAASLRFPEAVREVTPPGRSTVKYLIASTVFITILTLPAARAQQTNTDCTISGNTANCTSTTTPDYSQGFAKSMDQFSKSMQDTTTNLQGARAARTATLQAEVNIVYCQQNPEGYITTKDGAKPCSEETARVVAFCTIKPKNKLCKFFAQHRAVPVVKP
jgi:hypothetical protein